MITQAVDEKFNEKGYVNSLHKAVFLGDLDGDHSYIKTEADLNRYSFASKKNYGPGVERDMIEFFPTEWFGSPKVYESMFGRLKDLQTQLKAEYNDIFQIDVDLIHQEQEMNCTTILCLFLIYTFRQISSQFYRELVVFLVFLRHEFNSSAVRMGIALTTTDEQESFADIVDANLIPQLINEFILLNYKTYLEDQETFKALDSLQYLTPAPHNFNKVVSLSKFLCEWLYHFSFTEMALNFIQLEVLEEDTG